MARDHPHRFSPAGKRWGASNLRACASRPVGAAAAVPARQPGPRSPPGARPAITSDPGLSDSLGAARGAVARANDLAPGPLIRRSMIEVRLIWRKVSHGNGLRLVGRTLYPPRYAAK